MARGSNLEVQTQLVIAVELGYGNSKLLKEADNLSNEVSKVLNSLQAKL
jgi:four helix bundle protein